MRNRGLRKQSKIEGIISELALKAIDEIHNKFLLTTINKNPLTMRVH
jgi:hypothetical protein